MSPTVLQRVISVWRLIYLARVPILTALIVFVGLRFAAFGSLGILFKGLFDLKGFWQNFFFSLFAFLLAYTVMIILKLIIAYGPERVNFEEGTAHWVENRLNPWFKRYNKIFWAVTILAWVFLSGVFAVKQPAHPLNPNDPFLIGIDPEFIKPANAFAQFFGLLGGWLIALAVLFLTELIQSTLYFKETADKLKGFVFPFHGSRPFSWLLERTSHAEGRIVRGIRAVWAWIFRLFDFFLGWLKNRNIGEGFFDYSKEGKTPELHGEHSTAQVLFFICFAFYVVYGAIPFLSNRSQPLFTAITYIPLTAAVLCSFLSVVAFFFDRFRVPLMLPVLLVLLVTSFSLVPTYDTVKHTESNSVDKSARTVKITAPNSYIVPPAEVVKNAKIKEQTDNPAQSPNLALEDYVIIVTADGGGIQAAAWTARVLTGLEIMCAAEEFPPQACGKKIRLISAVSGGSVGAMYFVDAYKQEGLIREPERLNKIFERTAKSSLKNAAWGITYSDLGNTVLFNSFPTDRGRELEKAWISDSCPPGETTGACLKAPLSSWIAGVREGWRPAVMFNATIAETGERLLFATSDIEKRADKSRPFAEHGFPPTNTNSTVNSNSAPLINANAGQVNANSNGNGDKNKSKDEKNIDSSEGSRNFYQIFPGYDVSIATAARLSSTFPYVAPAASARNVVGNDSFYNRAHIVDGGYYDNYGMSSATEWLKELLDQREVSKVLILQIRCNDTGYAKGSSTADGWFYQLSAPIATMYSTRVTAQRSHNDIEFELLKRNYEADGKTQIKTVIFNYRSEGYEEEPPLSWHLTDVEKAKIVNAWNRIINEKHGEWNEFKNIIKCFRDPLCTN